MKQFLILSLVLVAMWLLWSGHYTPLLLSFGAISCAIAVFITYRMDALESTEEHPIRLSLRLFTYIPWLLGAIVKANIDIARRILSPSMPISPNIVHIEASQHTEVGQAIYANSITLTPGTITIQINGNEYLVHAISEMVAKDLLTGEMERRVAAVFEPEVAS